MNAAQRVTAAQTNNEAQRRPALAVALAVALACLVAWPQSARADEIFVRGGDNLAELVAAHDFSRDTTLDIYLTDDCDLADTIILTGNMTISLHLFGHTLTTAIDPETGTHLPAFDLPFDSAEGTNTHLYIGDDSRTGTPGRLVTGTIRNERNVIVRGGIVENPDPDAPLIWNVARSQASFELSGGTLLISDVGTGVGGAGAAHASCVYSEATCKVRLESGTISSENAHAAAVFSDGGGAIQIGLLGAADDALVIRGAFEALRVAGASGNKATVHSGTLSSPNVALHALGTASCTVDGATFAAPVALAVGDVSATGLVPATDTSRIVVSASPLDATAVPKLAAGQQNAFVVGADVANGSSGTAAGIVITAEGLADPPVPRDSAVVRVDGATRAVVKAISRHGVLGAGGGHFTYNGAPQSFDVGRIVAGVVPAELDDTVLYDAATDAARASAIVSWDPGGEFSARDAGTYAAFGKGAVRVQTVYEGLGGTNAGAYKTVAERDGAWRIVDALDVPFVIEPLDLARAYVNDDATGAAVELGSLYLYSGTPHRLGDDEGDLGYRLVTVRPAEDAATEAQDVAANKALFSLEEPSADELAELDLAQASADFVHAGNYHLKLVARPCLVAREADGYTPPESASNYVGLRVVSYEVGRRPYTLTLDGLGERLTYNGSSQQLSGLVVRIRKAGEAEPSVVPVGDYASGSPSYADNVEATDHARVTVLLGEHASVFDGDWTNYLQSDGSDRTVSGTFSIGRATWEARVSGLPSYDYDGTAHRPALTGGGEGAVEYRLADGSWVQATDIAAVRYSDDVTNATAAATVTATLSDGFLDGLDAFGHPIRDNYRRRDGGAEPGGELEVSGSFEIRKATATLSLAEVGRRTYTEILEDGRWQAQPQRPEPQVLVTLSTPLGEGTEAVAAGLGLTPVAGEAGVYTLGNEGAQRFLYVHPTDLTNTNATDGETAWVRMELLGSYSAAADAGATELNRNYHILNAQITRHFAIDKALFRARLAATEPLFYRGVAYGADDLEGRVELTIEKSFDGGASWVAQSVVPAAGYRLRGEAPVGVFAADGEGPAIDAGPACAIARLVATGDDRAIDLANFERQDPVAGDASGLIVRAELAIERARVTLCLDEVTERLTYDGARKTPTPDVLVELGSEVDDAALARLGISGAGRDGLLRLSQDGPQGTAFAYRYENNLAASSPGARAAVRAELADGYRARLARNFELVGAEDALTRPFDIARAKATLTLGEVDDAGLAYDGAGERDGEGSPQRPATDPALSVTLAPDLAVGGEDSALAYGLLGESGSYVLSRDAYAVSYADNVRASTDGARAVATLSPEFRARLEANYELDERLESRYSIAKARVSVTASVAGPVVFEGRADDAHRGRLEPEVMVMVAGVGREATPRRAQDGFELSYENNEQVSEAGSPATVRASFTAPPSWLGSGNYELPDDAVASFDIVAAPSELALANPYPDGVGYDGTPKGADGLDVRLRLGGREPVALASGDYDLVFERQRSDGSFVRVDGDPEDLARSLVDAGLVRVTATARASVVNPDPAHANYLEPEPAVQTFVIRPDAYWMELAELEDVDYDGSEQRPDNLDVHTYLGRSALAAMADAPLREGADYLLTFERQDDATGAFEPTDNFSDSGTLRVTATLTPSYADAHKIGTNYLRASEQASGGADDRSASQTFRIRPLRYALRMAELEPVAYDGRAHEPEPTVYISLGGADEVALDRQSYELSYASNTDPGTARVTARLTSAYQASVGIGLNYQGRPEVTGSFEISGGKAGAPTGVQAGKAAAAPAPLGLPLLGDLANRPLLVAVVVLGLAVLAAGVVAWRRALRKGVEELVIERRGSDDGSIGEP